MSEPQGNQKGILPRRPKVNLVVIYLMQDGELAADMVQQTILTSFHHNCPTRVALSPKRVLSWHKELTCLKTLTR
jgi:hypothetical protein